MLKISQMKFGVIVLILSCTSMSSKSGEVTNCKSFDLSFDEASSKYVKTIFGEPFSTEGVALTIKNDSTALLNYSYDSVILGDEMMFESDTESNLRLYLFDTKLQYTTLYWSSNVNVLLDHKNCKGKVSLGGKPKEND